MATVAPAPGSITGELGTFNINVNDPVQVQRVIQTLVNLRLIGKKLLKSRVNMTGSGSAIFTANEALGTTHSSERIADNQDYPLTDTAIGTPTVVSSDKWALGTEISDLLVARRRWDEVALKVRRLANQITQDFDAVALSAISTAVTQTQAAVAAWDTTNGVPFTDVMQAAAQIDEANRGWMADTTVLTPSTFAWLLSRAQVLDHMPREGAGNPLLTGNMVQLAGMTFIKSTNLPAGVEGIVLDSNALGAVAYEDQGGGYQGSPEDVQSKTFRREGNDGVRIQARLVNVPMIREAGAAVELTGLTT